MRFPPITAQKIIIRQNLTCGKWDPDFVPAELPLPEISMIDVFEESAKRVGNRPAVHYFDQTLTYAQLDDLADRFATLLAGWGVDKGDRVAVYVQNNPQFLIAQYGAWKRGAAVVPLNPMFKEKEVEYHLQDSGAKVMVALDSLYAAHAEKVIGRTDVQQVITTHESDLVSRQTAEKTPLLNQTKKFTPTGTVDLVSALRQTTPDPSVRVAVSPEDIAYLVYTSGTTGRPKGAMNLHRNVAYNANVYRIWMQMGDEDGVLGLAPLFHITGIVGHAALAARAGIPLVLFHRFDARVALEMIERWKPTMTVASITAFIALMNAPEAKQADVGSMSKYYSGGAPIAPSLVEQFERAFGGYIHNIYGLTESNSPTHAVPLGVRAPVDPGSGALSVGIPVPNCLAKVVDLEDPGREVGVGEPGEFAVRGPMIFSGYWNKPEATKNAFHDGYFLTGDVVVMDEDGWFYVVDRKKDMINASGYKVWPREVEDTLYQHPAVKEAAVVGVPDPYRGETVKAFVALRDEYAGKVTTEEIVQFCKERLAAYKYPRLVEFLPEIPKTASGKFLRRELRERSSQS
ncbi:long-chain-fatty-acid--CoA ligase [Kyrpidia spormannii]|uniref:Acyl-CoA synthetase n=2 Tax=Kyrpidia spormannii TaxID=2055160 RepID=A0A6F9EAV4_9BACL|nr:long-chain fatty acid--CoA ligase [Kyrpidia spormannii]CAB3394020.1 Acyl-CoA synthetase [Kyrpidia spormannii]